MIDIQEIRLGMGRGLACSVSEWGQVKSFFDSGIEALASIKCGEFLD